MCHGKCVLLLPTSKTRKVGIEKYNLTVYSIFKICKKNCIFILNIACFKLNMVNQFFFLVEFSICINPDYKSTSIQL